MSTERWKRIDALFRRALEVPASERTAFLEEACGDDADVRVEVEALLEAAHSEEDFFGGLAERAGLGGSRERQAAIEDLHGEIDTSEDRTRPRTTAAAADLLSRLGPALADRYEIQRELGEGGMAVVFLARDARHDRPVALKVMKPETLGSAGADRFLREIRIAANLQHPHLLPLLDSGEVDGLLYYAMPYVEGESLEERLRRERQLSLEEAIRIVREVADGLGHAHRRGLIHRDVKPANVLLSGGHALVADFGVARAMDQASGDRLTSTGLAIGTPSYMSPEQWESTGPIDGRADQYALGCMLYEMLVGEPPFTGPTPQVVLARHARDEVPSIRTARSSVPPGIEGVVRRAMAKIPAERYPDLEAFDDALRRAAAGETAEHALPMAAVPVSVRRARPRAVGWIVATALALAAVAAGVRFLGPTDAVAGASRVVVGYFEDGTARPELAQVGKIAIDRITGALLADGTMEVVPPPTALQASRFVQSRIDGQAEAGRTVDPIRALASETGAGTVVSGRYRVDGDTLVLTLTISDVDASGRSSALGTVEGRGPADDPMQAIEAARDHVLGTLALAGDERVEATRAPSYRAYLEFSRGLDDYIDRRFEAAIPRLRRATELDSTFVVPLVYAGLCYVNVGERARADSLVRVLVDREVSLSSYHRHWLDYLSAQLRGDRDAALEAMRAASRIAPGSKAVYNRAYVALQVNRPREALEALLSVDPARGPMRDWIPYWYVRADARHMLRQYDEELADARRVRELRPNARYSYQLVARALIGRGDEERARVLTDSVVGLRLESDPIRPVVPGSMYHELAVELEWHGHPAAAAEFFRKAEAAYARWESAHPDSARGRPHRIRKASLYHDAGRFGEALSLVEDLRQRSEGDVLLRAWRGILLAALGHVAEARAIEASLQNETVAGRFGEIFLARARIQAQLGDLDRAVALLLAAFDEGLPQPLHPDNNFRAFWDDDRLLGLFVPER